MSGGKKGDETDAPWKLPNPATHGDPEIATIYTSVGAALSVWERMEHQMSNIFAELVTPGGLKYAQHAARYAYGAVMASGTRADMLEGAAHAFFSPLLTIRNPRLHAKYAAMRAELDGLTSEVGKFAGRRNNIAHGVASLYFLNKPEGNGYCLVPPLYATKHYVKTSVYPYAFNAAIIDGFREHFFRLGETAHRYASDLQRLNQDIG